MLVAALSLIALTCIALLVPVPYVTMRPGPAFDTLGEFEVKPMFDKSVKTYPTNGSLDFTTVSVTRADSNVSLGRAITSYFSSDIAVVPKSLIYPDNETATQSTKESAAELDSSKDSSRVAALRAAGFTVTGTPQIVEVAKGGAADGKLMEGDLVIGVGDTLVDSAEALVKAVGAYKPGDIVKLSISRKGATQDISMKIRVCRASV